MKTFRIFLLFLTFTFGYATASTSPFIIPVSFPKTAEDYSFTERLENKATGYKPYAGLSAYQIINFEAMEDEVQRAIEEELAKEGIEQSEDYDTPDQDTEEPTQEQETPKKPTPKTKEKETPEATPEETTPNQQPTQVDLPAGYCSRKNPHIKAGQKTPFGLPVNTEDLTGTFTDKRTKSIIKNTNKGLFCSPYGCGRGRPHKGVDIGCTEDFYQMPIYTTADGTVELITHATKNSSAGNYIRIKHTNGWTTQYMHLDKILVKKGQKVSAGCMIGLMGHTGGSSDQKYPTMDKDLTHLHYEIIYYGSNKSVTAPNGKKIKIVRGEPGTSCGAFDYKIYPNKIMVH
ncbi:MAG: M23 family metallopeptidase [Alphaproteobacteria bacterium]|nr:M23 family metallopeptidase [Alphaproteobacteria bacterium]